MTRGSAIGAAGGAAALLVAAALLAGCAKPPLDWEVEKRWRTRVLAPPERLDASLYRPGDPSGEYNLYLLTHAVGLSFEDAGTLMETLYKHPRGDKKAGTVGHAWVMLESPDELLEFGHTGEYGARKPTYYDGFYEYVRDDHPDPASYLFEDLTDGRYHEGNEGHEPTFVAKIPIDAAAHARIRAFMDAYPYPTFSMVDQVCTDYVSGIAAQAGVNLAHRIELEFPPEVWFRGRTIPMWTDPRYRDFEVGSPDVLEEDLRALVEAGIATDVTAWYVD